MRSRIQWLVTGCFLLALVPTAEVRAGWVQPWVGYHATLELRPESPALSARLTTAASFPNGYTLTSWFFVDPAANALLFCHGLTQFPPAGMGPANLKIKKVTTRFYSGETEEQIGNKLVTKKTNNKACKRTMITPGEESVYSITTFNKVTGTMPDTTGLVPFGNVQQQVLASPVAAETLSAGEYRKARRQVRRYAATLKDRPAER